MKSWLHASLIREDLKAALGRLFSWHAEKWMIVVLTAFCVSHMADNFL
ncbi:MAG: hypothetical protein KF740_20120 [Ramlibacter sp.]|nr:hypothetical protein [Ramlibacter sp.]